MSKAKLSRRAVRTPDGTRHCSFRLPSDLVTLVDETAVEMGETRCRVAQAFMRAGVEWFKARKLEREAAQAAASAADRRPVRRMGEGRRK
jgi:hypothetical protein